MRLIKIVLLFVTVLFSNEILSQNSVSSEKTAALDSLFTQYKNRPGCAVGVFYKGTNVFSKGYGLANLGYDIPITTSTVFEAASVSKQFTAACITLLEIEGKLQLKDPIQKYIPELPRFKGVTITVGNLVYQTSGLRDYLALLYSKGISWNSNMNNIKALKMLLKQKGLNFKSGSQFAYSNTNYMLLSIIVERVSGKSIGAFAKERFFAPLGMKHTFYYEDSRKVIKNKAIGYEYDGKNSKREHYFNSTTTGDGGVYININDFYKWNENLRTGKVGGRSFINKMKVAGTLTDGTAIGYGRGQFVGDYYNITGVPTLRHSGNWAGFRSVYCRFLSQDFTVVVLSNNASTNVWGLLDEIASLFIQEDITKARINMSRTNTTNTTTKTVVIPRKELEKFTGNYLNTINGELRTIIVKNDTLIYRRSNGRETKLVAIDKKKFMFLGAPHVVIEFDKSPLNSATLTIGNGSPIKFSKYTSEVLTRQELRQFEGFYTNDELEVVYEIRADKNVLKVLIEGNELVTLEPLTKNISRADHFGYIQFTRNENGVILGFSRHDDTITHIKFVKIEDTDK